MLKRLTARNKRRLIILGVMAVFISSYGILNMEVSIQQGRDFVVSPVKMSLYMKIIDFWTRYNHHKLLVKNITKDCKSDREILEVLFKWTSTNIRPVPHGFPIFDDHVDNIIIRGYGTDDQSADVFTTLITVAGLKGGIYLTKIFPEKYVHAVSIVELNNRLLLFDTYYNLYFLNKDGDIASLDEIRDDIDIVKRVANGFKIEDKYEYVRFFQGLKPVNNLGWTKADMQMPLNRLIYISGRLLGVLEPSRVFYGETYYS